MGVLTPPFVLFSPAGVHLLNLRVVFNNFWLFESFFLIFAGLLLAGGILLRKLHPAGRPLILIGAIVPNIYLGSAVIGAGQDALRKGWDDIHWTLIPTVGTIAMVVLIIRALLPAVSTALATGQPGPQPFAQQPFPPHQFPAQQFPPQQVPPQQYPQQQFPPQQYPR
jgi:hypothetical protein